MQDLPNSPLYTPVLAVSLAFGLAGWLWPALLLHVQYPLLALLVLAVGLPHGATDYLLFRRLRGRNLLGRQKAGFFLCYLGAALIYLLGWLWLPLPALGLFLVISMYHFGQSNWAYLPLPTPLARFTYLLWGAFVLGGAVLWHWPESNLLIGQLTGVKLGWTAAAMAQLQVGLVATNLLWVVGLWLVGYLGAAQAAREALNLGVLAFMLYFTPLLVGFALYFTLWHSLTSLLQQLAFFRRQTPQFGLVDFYRQAAPYTLLAVLGLGALALAQDLLFPQAPLVGLFFVLIACVTLPHMVLIEESFQ